MLRFIVKDFDKIFNVRVCLFSSFIIIRIHIYIFLNSLTYKLLTGGGGHRGAAPKPQSEVGLPALAGVVSGKSLMDMGTKGNY